MALPARRPVAVEALEDRRLFAGADLDPSFSGDGVAVADYAPPFAAVARQADGKLVVAGDRNGDFLVARYNANGSIDTSFSGDGWTTVDLGGADRPTTVAVTATGKIVVAGGTRTGTAPGTVTIAALAQLNPNGSLDTAFSGDGRATFANIAGAIANIAVQDGGGIIGVGTAGNSMFVARFFANGLADNAFGADSATTPTTTRRVGSGTSATSVLLVPDGRIVVGGSTFDPAASTSSFGSDLDLALFRFNDDGSSDNTFGTTGTGYTVTNVSNSVDEFGNVVGPSSDRIVDLAAGPDGRIIALARVVEGEPSNDTVAPTLIRYSSQGIVEQVAIDRIGPQTDAGRQALPAALAIKDNAIYVGGTARVYGYGGSSGGFVARYGMDLKPDVTFNPDGGPLPSDTYNYAGRYRHVRQLYYYTEGELAGSATVNDLLIEPGGKVVLAGSNYQAPGDPMERGALTRLQGSAPATFVDPDDQISEAPSIGTNTLQEARTFVGPDVNLRKFTVSAGQRVAFNVDRASDSGLDSYLRLFNSAGTQLAANDDGAAPGETLGKDSYLAHTFATGGTYYIGVSGKGNQAYNPVTGAGDAPPTGVSWGAYTLVTRLVNPATVTLQAESATLGLETVASTRNAGYTGSGYADFAGAGSYADFTVNRDAPDQVDLTIRYANGSTADRPFAVSVGGSTAGTFPCPPTGSGSTWKTQTLSNVRLAAGTTRIRIYALGYGADLDALTITTIPPRFDPPTLTLQGEAAVFGGGTVANAANAGYTGSGYADFAGAGSYAQFTVDRVSAGPVNLAVRYANGSAANRPFDVFVRGFKVGQLACPPTGSGSAWATLTLANVSLSSGQNLIRFVAVGAGADLDQLVVTKV
jgi:uncharacterized delta-60 repeat protein